MCRRDLQPATSSTIIAQQSLSGRVLSVSTNRKSYSRLRPQQASKTSYQIRFKSQTNTTLTNNKGLRDTVGSISAPPHISRPPSPFRTHTHPAHEVFIAQSVGISAVLRNEPGEVNIRLQGSVFGHQRLRLAIFTRDGGVKSNSSSELFLQGWSFAGSRWSWRLYRTVLPKVPSSSGT